MSLKIKRLITLFGMFYLSFVFAYAGVAGAFNPCDSEPEVRALEQIGSRNLEVESLSWGLAPRLADQSQSVAIHCAESKYKFDIAAPTSSFASLIQFRKAFHVQSSLPHGSASSPENAAILKSSHLVEFSPASPPDGLSRQILSSVFLI